MRTFKDNAGRTWSLTLNVWTVKKVRDLLGVDLLDLGERAEPPNGDPARRSLGEGGKPGLLFRLIADPVLLVDVIYVVCKDQADSAPVTDEQFGRAMGGDAIDAATKAFLEELADFTPSPRDRARARKVIDATWKLIDRAQDLLDAKAEKELPAAVETALNALAVSEQGEPNRGSSSTSSPASSESSPAP
jgi:hypothetical protein